LLISEFRADLAPELFGKLVALGTSVERLEVAGQPAVWILGKPHEFFYRDPTGRVQTGTARLAGNVLLVQRGRMLIRLEGGLSKRRAVAIGRSFR